MDNLFFISDTKVVAAVITDSGIESGVDVLVVHPNLTLGHVGAKLIW